MAGYADRPIAVVVAPFSAMKKYRNMDILTGEPVLLGTALFFYTFLGAIARHTLFTQTFCDLTLNCCNLSITYFPCLCPKVRETEDHPASSPRK